MSDDKASQNALERLHKLIAILSSFAVVYKIVEGTSKYLWSVPAETFFGVPRDYFYSNFLANGLATLFWMGVFLIAVFFPLIVKYGNENFQSVFQDTINFIVYSYLTSITIFYFLILALFDIIYPIFNYIGFIPDKLSLFTVFVMPILFGILSYFFVKNGVNNTNKTNTRKNRKREEKLSKVEVGLVITIISLTVMIIFWGIFNISRTPITDKKYEIVEKDSKVFLVVPRTEKETILIEVKIDESKKELTFEKGKYIIGDKKDFEKIEYRTFKEVHRSNIN